MITEQDVRRVLGSRITENLPIHEITYQVSEATGVSVADILGKRRFKHFVEARQAVMLAASKGGYSLTEIGHELGNRDHTTIMHGIRRAKERLEANQ